MSGYAGDLSEKQQHSLDEFKYRLRDIWNEEFTDPFLLRWLRARDFDVNKSEKLLRDNIIVPATGEYRLNHRDLRKSRGAEALLSVVASVTTIVNGRPIWLLRFGNAVLRKEMLQRVSKEALLKHFTYIVEKIIADMKAQSKKLGKLVDTITVVFDFDNFGIRQVYSHQVPSFFQIFWKFVRPFLTERTVGRIQIFSREGWQPVLLKCVDPSQLPAHWGGDLVGPDGDTGVHPLGSSWRRGAREILPQERPSRFRRIPNAATCCLERGQKMDVPVRVDSEGSTLYWKFQTSPGHDVGFGVLRISGEHAKPKEVLEVGKV
uniref:Putative phosphatidylinositol transfer protein sec14 n=1 Tax=Ixodes ricinus TaxID=34613 RepID=A0A090XCF9_IXORI